MEVDEVGEDQNPSSNGGMEQNPSSSNGGSKHHDNGGAKQQEKEGRFLLGSPKFSNIGNGRFRCVETGHELSSKDKDSYSLSKGCRLALIDAAVSQKKPPLNLFSPHPQSKSKLVCELTGDTVNKSEEHIWKHISGKRFQSKLEQKEVETMASPKKLEENTKQARQPSKSSLNKDKEQSVDGEGSTAKKSNEHDNDPEGPDFWTPAIGSRWDFDDGKDRWEPCEGSSCETDDGIGAGADGKDIVESKELSRKEKRKSIGAVGPSSFASRKKKTKRAPSGADGKDIVESEELSRKAKRMSIGAVGPSSFASRKKKTKRAPSGADGKDIVESKELSRKAKRMAIGAVGPSSSASRKKKTKRAPSGNCS